MWRKNRFYVTFVLGVASLCLFASALAFAHKNMPRHPKTDTEKIADALRAGPAFITKDATLLDWPPAPGGEYRVLRKGSNDWTCLPGIPGYPHDEPGCFDTVFLKWIQDSLAGRTPHIDRVGISYMCGGAWAKSGKAGRGVPCWSSPDDCESQSGRVSGPQSRSIQWNAIRHTSAQPHRTVPRDANTRIEKDNPWAN